MTESLTAAAAFGNPVHFEGTEERLNSAIEQMHLSGLMKKRLSKCTDGEKNVSVSPGRSQKELKTILY